ncbi:MAG: hypothetical protein GTN64_09055, partial [Candidatus Latescibacteria bacterium]|nr:hypothetical protein [Candidatus Latescibacterota bacterium]NIO78748.1 hypothetical protein [Candidatus Latescibacterota bacterium]
MTKKVASHNGRLGIGAALLLGVLGIWLLVAPAPTYGKSAAEALKAVEGLTGKEREEKLIEGAKREGKMVFYG